MTFDVLEPFVAILSNIQKELPAFANDLADIVVQLSKLTVASNDEVDTSRLNLEDLALWQKCPLLKQFLAKRWVLQYEKARADVAAADEKRLRDIDELLSRAGKNAPEDKIAILKVAKT
eukprot:1247646-Karenia_brevis.AAC.1